MSTAVLPITVTMKITANVATSIRAKPSSLSEMGFSIAVVSRPILDDTLFDVMFMTGFTFR